MTAPRPYYAEGSLSAAFYDLITAADRELAGDVELYAALAAPRASVLELGTGSGRLAFALAERGFAVEGVELAPAMLAQARARLARTAPDVAARIRFHEGDLTALDLGRVFELVLCPYFTLAHVPPGPPWRAAFAVVARHLAPGGAAAVHLPLVELMRAPGPADRSRPIFMRGLPGGGTLELRMPERRFDEAARRFEQLIEYLERDAGGAVARRSLERLTYYADDPRPYARAEGLVMDRPPLRLGGVGDVFVFRKR